MTQMSSAVGVSTPASSAGATRVLLGCGAVAGPLFVGTITAQGLTRTGFDFKVHALSQLSLGGLGWIQTANFIVCGLLFAAGGVGMRRVLHPGRDGTWAPWLVGIFGASLIWAGVFTTDPANGFPPGSAASMPEHPSWHSLLHNFGPPVGGLALTVACIIVARRFAGRRQWGYLSYCLATVLADIALSAVGFGSGDFRLALAGGALLWLWPSVIAVHLLADHPTPAASTAVPHPHAKAGDPHSERVTDLADRSEPPRIRSW
jgi:Protein of unknown function (DUF998)